MPNRSRNNQNRIRFSKMHGLGNDFVVLDAVTQNINIDSRTAQKLSDRRFGIGCDQVLVVEPPQNPNMDFRYRIFNQDGSEVGQCGNGARCFAKFVRDRKLTHKHEIHVETASGNITLIANRDSSYTVNMGEPIFEPDRIPLDLPAQSKSYQLEVEDKKIVFSTLSMGNPHAVIQVDDVDHAAVDRLGPAIERHPLFPERVNVGFSQIVNRGSLRLRVWERGAGETLACGTGACAAAVAGIELDQLDSKVTVSLPGGDLTIEWSGRGQPVMLTGPATTVFHGQIRL